MRVFRFVLSAISIALVTGSLSAAQYAGDKQAGHYTEDDATDKFVEPSSYFDGTTDEESTDETRTSLVDGKCACDVDLNDSNKCCAPLWVINAGAVILQRGTVHSTAIVERIGGASLLDGNAFRFNYAAGADISGIRQVSGFDRFDAIDFRYFGIQSSQASASITPGGVIVVPTFPPVLGVGALPLNADYRTQLYSAEFNLRRYTPGRRITLLAGARILQLNEQLNLSGSIPVLGPLGFTTSNNLYGGQVGADVSLFNRGGPLSVVCTGKAGLFGNSANGVSTTNFFAGSAESVNRLAFVGDFNVNALYQIGEHIAIRGGWQLLWIQGAAIAANQVGATNYISGGGINTAGNAFYQGAMGSITFMW